MHYKPSLNRKEQNTDKSWRLSVMSHYVLLRPSCKQLKIGIEHLEDRHQVEVLDHQAHPHSSKVSQEEVLVEAVDSVGILYLMGNQNSHLKKHLVDIKQSSLKIRF